MERRQINFRGSVQGVGFRATSRSIARGFAISGWVRNEPDGSVMLEAQGTAAEVDRFLAALREQMADLITSEDSRAAAVVGDERSFEIRR